MVSGATSKIHWNEARIAKSPWFWLASVFAISVAIGALILAPTHVLPIYQPSQLNPALVDPVAWEDENHRISDFELVNHLGDTVSVERCRR